MKVSEQSARKTSVNGTPKKRTDAKVLPTAAAAQSVCESSMREHSNVRLDPVAEYTLKAQNYDQSVHESIEILSRNTGVTLVSSPCRKPPSASSRCEGPQLPPSKLVRAESLVNGADKRCYFTKAQIGTTEQYYEGLALKGNRILMLASAMMLKGCPTISDEDMRRVKGAHPNEFSCLPRELHTSNGWRRISKYCHFSTRPIPDGEPFFHSKRRCHPTTSGFYYLLAAAVGMTRQCDIKALTVDDLMVLLADYPTQCDRVPADLIQDPSQWALVDKFCFFSGGPIRAEDTYYWADLNGNRIYMLVVLSPNLTPNELYALGPKKAETPMSVEAVMEVERVYDLTDKDLASLCHKHRERIQILPPHLHKPDAWTKVTPPEMAAAKEEALRRANEYEATTDTRQSTPPSKISGPISHLNRSATSILERAALGLICGSPSFDETILGSDQDNSVLLSFDQSSVGDDSVVQAKDVLRRYAKRQGVSVEELLLDTKTPSNSSVRSEISTTAESTVASAAQNATRDDDDDDSPDYEDDEMTLSTSPSAGA